MNGMVSRIRRQVQCNTDHAPWRRGPGACFDSRIWSTAGRAARRSRSAVTEVAANDKKLVSFFRRQNLLNANPLDKMRPPNVFQVRDLLGVWKVRSNPTCHYENQ